MGKVQSKLWELDCLPTHILKDHMDSFIPILTKIVNLSLESGVFSKDWKTAILRPLLKKSGLDLIDSNYSPVSNLSLISKLAEWTVINQVNTHCNLNGITPIHQLAYRQFHGCKTALIKIVNDILWAMEHKNITILVIINLSAAFGTVDHKVLLEVLQKCFGVEGRALDWFQSYLSSRFFKVSIGDVYSTSKESKVSVPQGWCAGPSLFNAYSSTLVNCIPKGISISGFADNQSLQKVFWAGDVTDEQRYVNEIESCLINVGTWMKENRLKINVQKTELIFLGSKQKLKKCETSQIKVIDEKLERSNVTKYLGSWLDESLSFVKHATMKCNAATWNIHRTRKIC